MIPESILARQTKADTLAARGARAAKNSKNNLTCRSKIIVIAGRVGLLGVLWLKENN
jgi:hypothetical protein